MLGRLPAPLRPDCVSPDRRADAAGESRTTYRRGSTRLTLGGARSVAPAARSTRNRYRRAHAPVEIRHGADDGVAFGLRAREPGCIPELILGNINCGLHDGDSSADRKEHQTSGDSSSPCSGTRRTDDQRVEALDGGECGALAGGHRIGRSSRLELTRFCGHLTLWASPSPASARMRLRTAADIHMPVSSRRPAWVSTRSVNLGALLRLRWPARGAKWVTAQIDPPPSIHCLQACHWKRPWSVQGRYRFSSAPGQPCTGPALHEVSPSRRACADSRRGTRPDRSP